MVRSEEWKRAHREKRSRRRLERREKGLLYRPLRCGRCGLVIERICDWKRVTDAQSKIVRRLTKMNHKRLLGMCVPCWEKLPKRDKRILEGDDFTSQCINIKNEIWLRLNEDGDFLYDTMFSDVPEVDRRLQEMKLKDKLSPGDLETLKNLLNDMGGENA